MHMHPNYVVVINEEETKQRLKTDLFVTSSEIWQVLTVIDIFLFKFNLPYVQFCAQKGIEPNLPPLFQLCFASQSEMLLIQLHLSK